VTNEARNTNLKDKIKGNFKQLTEKLKVKKEEFQTLMLNIADEE